MIVFICLFLKTSALIRLFALVQQASGPENTHKLYKEVFLKNQSSNILGGFNVGSSYYYSCNANNESPCMGVKPPLLFHSTMFPRK